MREKKALIPLILLCAGLLVALYLIQPDSILMRYLNPPEEPDQPEDPKDPQGPGTPDDPGKPEEPSGPDQPTDPDDPGRDDPVTPVDPPDDPSQEYRYAVDVSDYLDAINWVQDTEDVLVVNKKKPLGGEYIPPDLVMLDTSDTLGHKEIQLDARAASALKAMILCMRAEGIRDAFVTSAYRSYAYQKNLFQWYIQKEMEADRSLTKAQAQEKVLTYSAAPGTSEHQSGLCVDFMTTTMRDLDETFEQTAAFSWLEENACQFGFILRYPKGKEDVTGYKYEPWHYRYVGRELAMAVRQSGLPLEAYLATQSSQIG